MSDDEVARLVNVGGGDPECLHCQLGVAVRGVVRARAGSQAQATELLGALQQLAGEIIAQAPAAMRAPMLAHCVKALSAACGFEATAIEMLPVDKVH